VSVTGLSLTFNPALAAGDRITISAGAVADAAGNKSLQRSFTAIAEQKSPRITSVLMSQLNHSTQAVAQVPDVLTGGAGTLPDADRTDAEDIWIAAKSDGAAAGAVGNGWSITFDRASSYDPEKDLDIDVRVNSRDRAVFVRFNNGEAKFQDLQAALEGNSAFDAMFEVKVDADSESIAGGACGKPAENVVLITALERGAAASTVQMGSTTSGVTKVAIQVTFNAYISAHENEELLNDVLAETLARAVKADGAATITTVRDALALGTSTIADNTTAGYPGTRVSYSATTPMAGMLPQVRDLVVTTRVASTNLAATSYDDTVDVATGYADDVATTANQDENKNDGSQVRIGRSSAVDAPK
jgi:hypothetical protein